MPLFFLCEMGFWWGKLLDLQSALGNLALQRSKPPREKAEKKKLNCIQKATLLSKLKYFYLANPDMKPPPALASLLLPEWL